jgi:DNA-binding NarL/FixJ family response regulator
MSGSPSNVQTAPEPGSSSDVLRLVAGDRSNAEIAAEPYLSRETVKTHVSSARLELGARDRTQAVIAAYESGFMAP